MPPENILSSPNTRADLRPASLNNQYRAHFRIQLLGQLSQQGHAFGIIQNAFAV
jgi:hypothetical protein